MPEFNTMGEAALHCEKAKCPFDWINKKGKKYVVAKPKKKKAAAKKKTAKRRTKKRATKKRTTKKRTTKKKTATKKRTTKRKAATKKRPTKKRATKKKTATKKAPAKKGAWGAAIKGTTPRAKFFRAQKAAGRSKPQAASTWKMKQAAKQRAREKKKRGR